MQLWGFGLGRLTNFTGTGSKKGERAMGTLRICIKVDARCPMSDSTCVKCPYWKEYIREGRWSVADRPWMLTDEKIAAEFKKVGKVVSSLYVGTEEHIVCIAQAKALIAWGETLCTEHPRRVTDGGGIYFDYTATRRFDCSACMQQLKQEVERG
jgi:hypothetical protein